MKRRAVSDVIETHGLSERRACKLADLDRSTFQYRKQACPDGDLRQRLRELANERRRFGYRRLGILLEREGYEVNHKKLFRIYREGGPRCTSQALQEARFGHEKTYSGAGSGKRTLEPGFCL